MSLKKASNLASAGDRGVQMRRPTNRRGKQAPTPPKRTSLLSSCSSFRESQYAADDQAGHDDGLASLNGGGRVGAREASSEGSLAEATPDTDDSAGAGGMTPGAEHRHRSKRRHHAHAQPMHPLQSSHDIQPKQGVQVVALEVQNVKRAINRYGTLPRGARIAKQIMKEMLELKLVAEIKERADKKKQKLTESPPLNEAIEMHTSFGDPVTRLVSELSESLNMEALRKTEKKNDAAKYIDSKETVSAIDLKASLRRTSFNNNVEKKIGAECKTNTDFKSQLKKVDTNRMNNVAKESEEAGRSIIDFKSRLRKVDGNSTATNGQVKRLEQISPEDSRKDVSSKSDDSDKKRSESGSLDTSGADEDDKRRSTGSISSLKKLWESKESDERLSPKMKPRGEEGEEDEKPAVASKPAMRARPVGKGGIYATPLASNNEEDVDALASLRVSLECCTNETSERLARLATACMTAAANSRCAPQLRVQLRAAAARLEAEARALASPQPHHHHLADGVEQALRKQDCACVSGHIISSDTS
ncbi:unnamed protein product, partial [Leptidea sinapis]